LQIAIETGIGIAIAIETASANAIEIGIEIEAIAIGVIGAIAIAGIAGIAKDVEGKRATSRSRKGKIKNACKTRSNIAISVLSPFHGG
jgi:hypothetical protein